MSNPALTALNGDVQRQGIKVNAEAWLDMGSQEWKDTPNPVKAAAYQAAKVCGWRDEGLLKLMKEIGGSRVDDDWAKIVLGTLHDLARDFPLEIEEETRPGMEAPVFKIQGCDRTLPFPS